MTRQRRAFTADSLLQDLRYALRALRRSPAFTAVAVVTLALGIGANTAIWSVASGVLLRPLPYPDPERLVMVWMDNTRLGLAEDWHSFPGVAEYRERSESLADIAVFNERAATFTGDGDPEWALGAHATANLWDVLGVRPAIGRTFTAEEDRPGADDVVVLSDRLWRRRFGGRADVVGGTVLMNELPRRVVGVMPPGFSFPAADTAFWIPTAVNDEMREARQRFWLQAIGRLAPGATVETAQAELERINAGAQERFPELKGYGVNVVGHHDQMVGGVRPAVLVLLAAVAFVLLIACTNVASLLLARASTRRREMALRAAIGAGRARLVRQLLTESVVLALAAGAVGLLLARFGLDALVAIAPVDLPRLDQIAIDGGVLAFAIALSVLTGLAFGLVPAIEVARADPAPALKEGGRSASPSGLRVRRGLVVAEVAVAVVLLVGAGLMVRSFLELLEVDLGFRTDDMLIGRVSLGGQRYGEGADALVVDFFRQLVERAEALPGVEGAAGTTTLFLSATPSSTIFMIEGRPAPPPEELVEIPIDVVTDDFFRVMDIPLRAGRFFDERDEPTATGDASTPAGDDGSARTEGSAAGAPAVVIVNETFARRFFAGEDPIGRRIRYGGADSTAPWMTIVGVVGDSRRTGFDAAVRHETFLPHAQAVARTLEIVVRTAGDPEAVVPDLRAILRSLDPAVPLHEPRPIADVVGDMTAQRRLNTLLMTIFAVVAVVVAAVGIYGVIAYSVEQRTRELGVRAALGASAGAALRLVLREGLVLAGIGLALGLIAALGLTRAMSSLLYGVAALDPTTFAVAAVAALATTVVACLVPARRAMRVDPSTALRAD
jgi:putative ABC transport system permease protein